MKLIYWLSVFSIISFSVVADTKDIKTVRFSIVESWPEPYAFFNLERNLTGGAIKELIEAIGKKMGVRVEHVHLSRNRVDAALESGKADVRCYISEAWTTKPESYLYTQQLFLATNSIIWKKGHKTITKLSDIEGKTIGTVAGYLYKTVDSLFKAGKAKRVDVSNEGMNVILLQKGRIDYVIVETASFNWSASKNSEINLKEIESFLVDSIPVKCGVLKKNLELFKSVNTAIEKLRQDGTIKAIISKYNLSR